MPSTPLSQPSSGQPQSEYLRQVATLNPRQLEALNEHGHTVVLAGPGSGKTKTLVLKIARLLDQTPRPRGVACLTYGQEAAREFETRLRELGIRADARLFTGTVHAFCLSNILRPFGRRLPAGLRHLAEYELANDQERATAREAGLAAAGVNEPEAWWSSKLDEFRRIVIVDPARASEGRFDDRLPRLAEVYAQTLKANRRIDFDDIVAGALFLVENDPYVRSFLAAKYRHFVVDEYQDLGLALHRIITTLMDHAGVTVFVVGDPDQSIFGFTGARPEFLETIAQRADVRPVALEMNYRSGQDIIDASLHVLQPTQERAFRSSQPEKGDIYFQECDSGLAEQASRAVARIKELIEGGVIPGEIGVLAARWDDLAEFEKELEARGVPYRAQRTAPYKSTPLTVWIEDLARWCAGGWRSGSPKLWALFRSHQSLIRRLYGRASASMDLPALVSLYRAMAPLRQPEMAVGDWLTKVITALDLRHLAQPGATVPLPLRFDVDEFRVLVKSLTSHPRSAQSLQEFSGLARNKVVLQSLHGSKGLQYWAVFLPALESGVLPRYLSDNAEARRLFYVGLTRARREVHLMFSGYYFNAKGRKLVYGASPFVAELWKRLKPS